jgi:DNA polymerase III delta subunit
VPALDLGALKKQIATGKLSPVYLFVGEDVRLMEQMVDAVEATVDPADRPFAVERLYAGEEGTAPVDIAASARVFPMLGDRRIVFVLRAERILKPKRAGKAAEAEDDEAPAEGDGGALDTTPLEDYVKAPSPSSVLVFIASEIDRSRRFTKRLVEGAQVVVFGGLAADDARARQEARRAAADQLRREFEAAGRPIEPSALQMLMERAGGDISKLRGDVERLMLYTEGEPRITRADVQEVAAAETAVEDEWAVVNAIGDGDVARALRETAARFDRGDSPHGLVGQLRWWVATKLAPAAPERVMPAMEALLRTDLALKSSGGDERVLVERLVVELTGRPVPRQAPWGSGRR